MNSTNRSIFGVSAALALLFSLASVPVLAQVGASEAVGKVVDRDDTAVPGAVVTFRAQSNPKLVYQGKTNKKGRYYIAGLYTPKENDMWEVTIEAEGYLPVHVRVESRNVNKVLIGDVIDQDLKFGSKAPDIMIRPMGKAMVDWVVSTAESVEAEARQQPVAAASGSAATGSPDGTPVQPEEDPWVEAVRLVNAGDLEGSLPFLEKAIQTEPDDVERLETHAKVLYQLERYAQAAVQAKAAVKLAPQRMESLMLVYSVQVAQEDFEQARATLEAARELAPDDIRVLSQIAYVADRTGDGPGAIAAHEAITALDPKQADSWLALGGLYAETGDMARSEKAYQRVADLDPSGAYQIFYNLGVLIINREDRDEKDTRRAIEAFRKALEIKPDYGQAHQQLAFALLGVGEQGQARQALEAYVKAAPNAPDVDQMRGLIKTLQN